MTIRLLKSLKYDKSPEATISSYDICAIVFNMPDAQLDVPSGSYLRLAKNLSSFLNDLVFDTLKREALYVLKCHPEDFLPGRCNAVFFEGNHKGTGYAAR